MLTHKDAERVAEWLRQESIPAKAYHSGVTRPDFPDTDAYRLHLEELLLENKIKALVATTALGMGYDKPDLGFVIHYQAPSSVIAYYQQVGRAGRAVDKAFGILFSGEEDGRIHEYFRRTAFPDPQSVAEILRTLEKHDGLSIRKLEEHVNLTHGQIEHVFKTLSVEDPSPIVKEGARWLRTPVPYELDQKRVERLTRQREREWSELRDYVKTPGCRMQYLLQALDESGSAPCGRCDNCIGEPLVGAAIARSVAVRVTHHLRHAEELIKPRIQIPRDAFPEYGLRGNLPEELRAEGVGCWPAGGTPAGDRGSPRTSMPADSATSSPMPPKR